MTQEIVDAVKMLEQEKGIAADTLMDALQDALLSAYKHMDQFRGQAQISTWLVAIVNNCARMQLRKRPRQIHLSLDEQIGDEEGYTLAERLADCGPSPEEECRRAEMHERIMQVTEELSPALRKAFELRDLEDLTTSEAAKILGVPEGTVKARVSRARTRLRGMMRRALHSQPGPTSICPVSLPVEKKQSNESAALLA